MVATARALLAFALAVAASGVAHGATIMSNPVSITASVGKLNKFNPAYGARVPKEATTYVVPREVTPLARAAAATSNGSDPRRALEASSTDVQRLEEHFGTAMDTGVDALVTGAYRAAEFSPMPWPSSYWPTYADGINYRWAGDWEPSAAEKYAAAFGLDVRAFTDAVSRTSGILSQGGNRRCSRTEECADLNDGSNCAIRRGESSGFCIPTWYGICHAWAPAAILEKEPRCPVTRGGQTFRVFDIKALLTQLYDGAGIGIVFTGARFNGPDWPDYQDEYGRYSDAARRDLGPGFFHIAITNILGRFRKSFIVDVTAGSEVWNQPVRGYEVLASQEFSRGDAAQWFFNTAQYPFNSDARRLMYVRTRLRWMNEAGEDGPIIENGNGDAHTASRDYEYLLELDDQRRVIGGEWVGNSRYDHPDFLWIPTGRPDINTVTDLGLSYRNVLELLDASVRCDGSDPNPNPPTPPPSGCAPTGGWCGNANSGATCCASPGDYCQPWNPWEYQCRAAAGECSVPQTGVDFYGDDIKALYEILPEQCCAECARTPGCRAYTFVNYNADGRAACYLKSGTGQRVASAGAVSAEVKNPLPSNPSCGNALGANCGSSAGHSCCPAGAYCQPWDSWYYQCISTPAQCSQQLTDVDFYGNDIRSVENVSPADCCAECTRTPGCRVYTFVNENPDGRTRCYLKSGDSGRVTKIGAVSGIVN